MPRAFGPTRPRHTVAATLAFLALGFAACQSPTQVRIAITTDIPCTEYGSVSVVGGTSFAEVEANLATFVGAPVGTLCDQDGNLGDIYATPGSDLSKGVILVRAAPKGVDPTKCMPPNYQGCVVAKRTFAFRESETEQLPIKMLSECIGEACHDRDNAQTCVQGRRCVGTDSDCEDGVCTFPRRTETPTAPPSPCLTNHLFCADFDNVAAVQDGWDEPKLDTPGTVNLSHEHAVSAPGSAEFRMAIRNTGTSGFLMLRKRISPASLSAVVIEFDVFVEKPKWTAQDTGGAGLLALLFDGTSEDINFSLQQKEVELSAPPGDTRMKRQRFPYDQWVHHRFEIDPVNGTVRVVSGTQTLSETWPGALTAGRTGMTLLLGLVGYANPTPNLHAYFDNVTIDSL